MKYAALLQFCTLPTDAERRAVFSEPVTYKGKFYATNVYVLLALDNAPESPPNGHVYRTFPKKNKPDLLIAKHLKPKKSADYKPFSEPFQPVPQCPRCDGKRQVMAHPMQPCPDCVSGLFSHGGINYHCLTCDGQAELPDLQAEHVMMTCDECDGSGSADQFATTNVHGAPIATHYVQLLLTLPDIVFAPHPISPKTEALAFKYRGGVGLVMPCKARENTEISPSMARPEALASLVRVLKVTGWNADLPCGATLGSVLFALGTSYSEYMTARDTCEDED